MQRASESCRRWYDPNTCHIFEWLHHLKEIQAVRSPLSEQETLCLLAVLLPGCPLWVLSWSLTLTHTHVYQVTLTDSDRASSHAARKADPSSHELYTCGGGKWKHTDTMQPPQRKHFLCAHTPTSSHSSLRALLVPLQVDAHMQHASMYEIKNKRI